MSSKINTFDYQYDYLEKFTEIHGNKYDYSKIDFVSANKYVPIICDIHGEFKQRVNRHCSGSGCIKCNNPKTIPLNNKTFKIKAKKIHGNDAYDYSKINYVNNYTEIDIICPIHGLFSQTPKNHLDKRGCPKCHKYFNDIYNNNNNYIKKAYEIHGNNKYDYSLLKIISSNGKVKIICNIHGIFEQIAKVHIGGSGCPKCGKLSWKNKKTLSNEEFIGKSKKIHKDKYDYSKVNYINSITKVIIICPMHGNFLQTPKNHIDNRGCRLCQYCPSCLLFPTRGLLCQYCKPQKENKLYKKTKEFKVVEYLRENIDKEFIHNESIGSDCTKNDRKNTNGHIYPDIRFDCIWFQLIVEIDEHQHRGAGYKCDKRRMYDVITKLGMPCVFIRYNPDNKKSNLKELENKINKYLKYEEKVNSKELKFDDFGYKCEYLFYK